MKLFIGASIAAILIAVAQSKSDYSYSAQYNWPGVCTIGKKQSPINVITRNVLCSPYLTPLQLSNEYFEDMPGTFENKGHTVEFTPQSDINAIMKTPIGQIEYKLLQFHMHWGAGQGEGSEHLVDGEASELEVHFVHKNVNVLDETASDAYAVLSVRGSMKDVFTSSTDIFSQLDVTNIKQYGSTPIQLSGINLASLLPDNLIDYYFYQGSLTTPDCNEVVQWFLLKDTIDVPLPFLAKLRMVCDKNNHPITFNFRSPQPLNGRPVARVC